MFTSRRAYCWAATLTVALLNLVPLGTASARTPLRTLSPVRVAHGTATFDLRSLRRAHIESGRLETPWGVRRVARTQLQRASKGGSLRLRLPARSRVPAAPARARLTSFQKSPCRNFR